MYASWLCSFLLFFSVCTVHAQNRSGEIDDPAWGLRFTPPAGWTPVQAPEGYVFSAPSQQGFLAVLPHEARTVEALRAEAMQGITDEYGTRLQVQGAIETFGDQGLAADFEGWIEGSPARARVIGLVSPHGTGATVLVATAPQLFSSEHAALVEEVARSVVFEASPSQTAQASQSQAASAEEQEWQDFLQGCRLSYFNRYNSGYGGGGYIDETVIDLCPGYFTFNDHTETVFNTTDPVSGNDPYIHRDQRGSGQWNVVRQGGQSVLELRFHDGSVKAFTLGWDDGKTFLDDRRWLRTCNPNDQVVEARPQCQ